MRKVIFLDKDGTIIPDIPYNVNPALITLNDGVGEGLSILQTLGYDFVIISNQAGIAFGYFKEDALAGVIEKVLELLSPWYIDIKALYYCPHHIDATIKKYGLNCDCRKPLPGLFKRAEREFKIDLNKSWMIGDILNDVEAGKRAGCKSVLIDNGNETEWVINEYRRPDFVAANFLAAAKYIEKLTQTDTIINAEQMANL